MSTCTHACPWKPEEGGRVPGAGVNGQLWSHVMECWELNSGRAEEEEALGVLSSCEVPAVGPGNWTLSSKKQSAFLPAEPPLQPQPS